MPKKVKPSKCRLFRASTKSCDAINVMQLWMIEAIFVMSAPSFDCQVMLASYNPTLIIGVLLNYDNNNTSSDSNGNIYGK